MARSEGVYLPWKLVFAFADARPGQVFHCEVQSAYPFRGRFLAVERPERFFLEGLRVGARDQLVTGVRCEVVSGVPLDLDTGVKGVSYHLRVRCVGDEARSFRAELRGTALLRDGEEPVEQEWEGRWEREDG